MKLFLKGARCRMAKCPVERGRPAPGMHGGNRKRKLSDYGVQLREKQRLRHQYGLQEGPFKLAFQKAVRKKGVTGEQLLQHLESRLDNVVYRLGFATSRRAARQFVIHGHVTVNGRRASVPSITLKAGSVVQVKDNAKSRTLAKTSMDAAEHREVPSWMAMDEKNFSGVLVRIPSREEIAPIVDEQLIVELYSK